MNTRPCFRVMIRMIAGVLFLAGASVARATTLYWDPAFTGSANGGGAGTWNATATNWWNGSANVVWEDGAIAVFQNSPAGSTIVGLSGLNPTLTSLQSPRGYNIGAGGRITLTGTAPTITTLWGGNGTYLYIYATLAGTNGVTFNGGGACPLYLSAAANYTGDTTVAASQAVQLYSGGWNCLPCGSGRGDVYVWGTLGNKGQATSHQINGLYGSGTVQFWGSSSTLTVGDGNANGTFSGVIAQNGGNTFKLTKIGLGRQVLSGVNTYNSTTLVSGGVLSIANKDSTHFGSINASSGITINGAELNYDSSTALSSPVTFTSGTLSGTGTVGTAVTVGPNAILSPGDGVGAQSYTAGLVLTNGGTYKWEMNSTTGTYGTNPGWDKLNVTNGLTLPASGTFTVAVNGLTGLGDAPTGTKTWNILSYDSLTGTFDPARFALTTNGLNATWTAGKWNLVNNTGAKTLQLTLAMPLRGTVVLIR